MKKLTCENCAQSYTETYKKKQYEADELFEYVSNSIVEVTTYDKNGYEYSLGSGFVYSSDGKIITNYHVIEKAYSAQITINGKSYVVKKVLAYDKDIDIAVLEITAQNLYVIPVCKEHVRTGVTVYAFGSAQGLTATFSNGIVTYASREMDNVTYIQHNADISSGSSGGPLINTYGEIIGINTFTLRESQNLNFAIFTTELDNLSYDNPMTMQELYNKENDVKSRMADYIVDFGIYDADAGAYALCFNYDVYGYNSGNSTMLGQRFARYYAEDDTVCLYFYVRMESGFIMQVCIHIEEIDDAYTWSYVDSDDDYIYGTLYANTYDSDTLLGYYANSFYGEAFATAREISSVLVNNICTYITYDFYSVDVTASDLGFYNYY